MLANVLIGVGTVLALLGFIGAVQDEPPSAELRVDICHNDKIVPVSVHGASKIDTGHGFFDPKTHVFSARVDAPGHDGDTVARYFVKVGDTDVALYVNPNSSCTRTKAPDSARKAYIEVCVDGTIKLFEGYRIEDLQAEADAYVRAKAAEKVHKVGTDCIPITTTTTVYQNYLRGSDGP